MNARNLDEAFQRVRAALPACRPAVAMIMGSGWAGASRRFQAGCSLPYSDIPHLGTPGTEGHPGRLLLARFAGLDLLLFQGRRHWYEGLGWEPVAVPVYVAMKLGAAALVITNAAGGIREDLQPGSLMAIDDHINAIGGNPLVGNRDPAWGPAFADQTSVYDPALRGLMDAAARRAGVALAHGVYLAACGPAYETPAEVRACRALGADAVGMSTAPEAALASAAGLRVAGLCCISNRAAGCGSAALGHDEVVAAASRAAPAMEALLCAFLEELAGDRAFASNLRGSRAPA
jgi:purine-nucleoside phosphorylase